MSNTVEFLIVPPPSSMVNPSEINTSSHHDDHRLSASLGSKGNAFRKRALSLAETQPSVETVIVKAKRAAQSLWMLLHAQVSHDSPVDVVVLIRPHFFELVRYTSNIVCVW